MAEDCKANVGLKTLIEHYRDVFRIPENVNHYCPKDYKIAEKKFIKYVLLGRGVRYQEET